ncbi:MAG: 2-oxo-3-hexenedioate decarboxylase [Gammaproteobacteria bacterium]|nr:2-oxo-3-hexenedioate decarboxylase [Gammaproteobacteria bacterium]
MSETDNHLTTSQINDLAQHLESAELNGVDVHKITDDYPDMTWKDAYDIQWAIRARKVAAGHQMVGLKMGLTSWAKMKQMGVDTPCYGFLADYFAVPDGGEIHMDELTHPKIEAEIAFVTNSILRGPDVDIDVVLGATDYVLPAMEVIDSRYRDFKFDLKSVVADNTSAARFVTGQNTAKIRDLDLETLSVELEINGEVVESGTGAAILGHPAKAIAMLANMLAERGKVIPAGTFVMCGAMTAAVTVNKGDHVRARYEGLGHVDVHCV